MASGGLEGTLVSRDTMQSRDRMRTSKAMMMHSNLRPRRQCHTNVTKCITGIIIIMPVRAFASWCGLLTRLSIRIIALCPTLDANDRPRNRDVPDLSFMPLQVPCAP